MQQQTSFLDSQFGKTYPEPSAATKAKTSGRCSKASAKSLDGGGIAPQPPRGKWSHAGTIVGEGWSLAWRMYDAQFWGVPQRRKRIYLVADFGSERAGEILFEPESLRGNHQESEQARESAAGFVAGCPEGSYLSFAWANSASAQLSVGEITPTVKATRNGEPAVAYCIEGHVIDRNSGQNGRGWAEGYAHTLNATDRHGVVCLNDQGGQKMGVSDDVTGCLRAEEHGHQPIVCYAPEGNHCGAYREDDVSATLQTRYHYGDGGDAALAVHLISNNPTDSRVILQEPNEPVQTLTARMGTGGNNVQLILETYVQPSFGEFHESEVATTLKASDGKRVDPGAVVIEQTEKPARKYVVRRLTPTECGRLQGFPDWWTDDAGGSDSAIYRMWGNGIALPCAYDVISRLADELRRRESA